MNEKVNEFKKNLIIETAQKYFKEFGYAGTQIDKIAKELGLGVGTIYSFFGSKDGLFFGWLFSIMDKAYREIKEQFEIEKNPILQCEIFVKYKLGYYEKNKSIFCDYIQNQFFLKDSSRGKENPMKRVYKLLSLSMGNFIKSENISNDFVKDVDHLAYMLDGIVDSYIEYYSQADVAVNLVTKTDDVMKMFLNAIGMGNYDYQK